MNTPPPKKAVMKRHTTNSQKSRTNAHPNVANKLIQAQTIAVFLRPKLYCKQS